MKRFSQAKEAEANGATTISLAMTSLAVGDGIMAGRKKEPDKQNAVSGQAMPC